MNKKMCSFKNNWEVGLEVNVTISKGHKSTLLLKQKCKNISKLMEVAGSRRLVMVKVSTGHESNSASKNV